ncbi:olfactory receptor 52D1-like [Peromyscus maniculatus bairdii]|uniref:olfactory receptor 52D1-like n=1 Tax=Peromyscus maniculatus bairdii TaxID=230844 RepID=UPI00077DA054|nr:olfactory receptor 52D1-like [Peromyscus maniculatus bairdii]XP_028744961.1 olfactory receptor 52D1-like [Peromyscus leucopus]
MKKNLRHLALVMSVYNKSDVHPSTFILIGIPGLEAAHMWISIPFCVVYILALVGNCSLLFIIKTDVSLHEPMYLFLCMLAVADLVVCTTAVPKLLSLFWFHDGEISFEACLTQVFLIHSCSTMESGFFLAMAFDRYVAICNPLRHSAILTHTVTGKIGLAVVLRGLALLSPHPFLLSWLPYCKTNIISHTYCEFMALIKIACAETSIRRAYSLVVAFLTGGVDFILIICSYVLILNTVFHLPSKDARLKTLSTCGSHVCVILVSYTPAFFSFLTHRFGHKVTPKVHIFVANIYLLVPPMVNPIIYGVRTKNIRNRFLKVFRF